MNEAADAAADGHHRHPRAGQPFLRQRIRGAFLAGLVLSIAGVIVLNGGAFSTTGDHHLPGDAVALGAALFCAGYFIFLSRARNAFSTSIVMLWSTIAAAICILPMALVFEPAFVPSMLAGWAVLLGLGWLVHAGGRGLIAFSLAWLPATFSSLTLLIQPVVAAVLARFVLHEPLGVPQVVGGFDRDCRHPAREADGMTLAFVLVDSAQMRRIR